MNKKQILNRVLRTTVLLSLVASNIPLPAIATTIGQDSNSKSPASTLEYGQNPKSNDNTIIENDQVKITFTVTQSWENGYVCEWNIQNKTDKDITDWNFEFDFSQRITSKWNIENFELQNGHAKMTFPSWSHVIAAGGSYSFGMVTTCAYGETPDYPKNVVFEDKSVGDITPPGEQPQIEKGSLLLNVVDNGQGLNSKVTVTDPLGVNTSYDIAEGSEKILEKLEAGKYTISAADIVKDGKTYKATVSPTTVNITDNNQSASTIRYQLEEVTEPELPEVVVNDPAFDGKILRLFSHVNDSSVMDKSLTSDDIHLWGEHKDNEVGQNQRWNFVLDKATDTYTIENTHPNFKGQFLTENNGKISLSKNLTAASQWKLAKSASTGLYEVVNASTGKRLDVTDSKTANGSKIQTWEKNGQNAQLWRLDIVGNIAPETPDTGINDPIFNGKTIQLVSHVNDKSVMDKTTDGIVLWEGHGGINQQWNFVLDAKTNTYTIENNDPQFKGQFLTEKDGKISLSKNLTAASQWKAVKSATSGLYEIVNASTGKRLDVTDSKTENGTNIQAWKKNGQNAQLWRLDTVKVDDSVNDPAYDGKLLKLITHVTDKSSLDKVGDNIVIWKNTNLDSQEWKFVLDKNTDTYTIENNDSKFKGQYLIENDGKISLSKTLSATSHWKLVKSATTGLYEVVNASTSRRLDVSNSGTTNGTIVQTWEKNGQKAQLWRLEVADDSVNDPAYDGKTLKLVSRLNKQSVLDKTKDSIVLWENQTGTNQQWTFVLDKKTNTYTIENNAPEFKGQYLTENEGKISLSKTLSLTSHWKLVKSFETGYYEVVNAFTSRRLDVLNSQTADGSVIQTWPKNDQNAQLWRLDTADNSINDPAFDGKLLKLVSHVNDKSVMDKTADSIVLWEGLTGLNQEWKFVLDSKTNTYTIESNDPKFKGQYLLEENGKISVYKRLTTHSHWKAVKSATTGLYEIVNAATGNRLDVNNSGTANGTIIQTHEKNGQNGQLWRLDIANTTQNDPAYDGKVLQLVTHLNDKSVMDQSVSTDNIHLWSNQDTANQKWKFVLDKNTNSYTIENTASVYQGLYLKERGNSTTISATITDESRWYLVKSGKAGFYEVVNASSGQRLDVKNAGTADGTIIQTHEKNGQNAQLWRLNTIDVPVNTPDFNGKKVTLVSHVNNNSVMDKTSNSLVLWEGHNGVNQQWNFVLDKNTDSYTIESNDPQFKGQYLSDTNVKGKVGLSKNLLASSYWKVVKSSTSGFYEVINTYSNLRLDVYGGITNNGTAIQGWKKTNGSNQLWRFDIVEPSVPENDVNDATFDGKKLRFISHTNDKSALDKTSNNIVLWGDHNGVNQQWSLVLDKKTNTYTIENKDPQFKGQYLTEYNGKPNLSSILNLSSHWILVKSPATGLHQIVNANTHRRLDVTNAVTKDGTVIQTQVKNGQNAQLWRIQEVKDLFTPDNKPLEYGKSYKIYDTQTGKQWALSNEYQSSWVGRWDFLYLSNNSSHEFRIESMNGKTGQVSEGDKVAIYSLAYDYADERYVNLRADRFIQLAYLDNAKREFTIKYDSKTKGFYLDYWRENGIWDDDKMETLGIIPDYNNNNGYLGNAGLDPNDKATFTFK